MTASGQTPAFVISLDFELAWGVRDHPSFEAYRNNLFGARAAVPALLQLFSDFGIHATWATVGLLFCDGREEALGAIPAEFPNYCNPALSPYGELTQLGTSEADDPLHFAPSLIRLVQSAPHQEIGTHTLSHFYCLEPTESVNAFRADLVAAQKIASRFGIELRSLVFPRNQYSPKFLAAAADLGIKAFRGTGPSWIYSSRRAGEESFAHRCGRLLDSYLPLSSGNGPVFPPRAPANVPATLFLRPYNPRLSSLEPIRLSRILRAMDRAAQSRGTFHLWWHPHNFGLNLKENLEFLTKILEHQQHLREHYGMESLTMAETAAAKIGKAHEAMA